MNAPTAPETAEPVTLDDKYLVERGRGLLSGRQALVRLPLLQRQLDRARGLRTAGFISGYRGSPLGSYDSELWKARHLLKQNDIVFQPGLNEDLAATAVWGTQQIGFLPGRKVDGVFAIWYGKGPGVDRSGDPIKHANLQGTERHGGVLLVFGDDHGGKSSSTAHQSDLALAAHDIPILYPGFGRGDPRVGHHGYRAVALCRIGGGPEDRQRDCRRDSKHRDRLRLLSLYGAADRGAARRRAHSERVPCATATGHALGGTRCPAHTRLRELISLIESCSAQFSDSVTAWPR
jgi:hypothetical protein